MSDLTLTKNEDDVYDLTITNGDFTSNDGLDTTILLALFVDKRAEPSEIAEASLRRGWIGNEQNEEEDYEIGSKLWLLYQSRLIDKTLNLAIDFVRDCFIWMIPDQLVKDIIVTGEIKSQNITITVNFVRFDDSSFTLQFDLWENTSFVSPVPVVIPPPAVSPYLLSGGDGSILLGGDGEILAGGDFVPL